MGFAAFAGLFWAIGQFFYNAAALSQSRAELLECGVETSQDTLALLTLGVIAASLGAFVSTFWRRDSLVLIWLGLEAALVLGWFLVGGGHAVSCAIE